MAEDVHPLIVEAIEEGAAAGVFRRAERLNPSVSIWRELADERSRKVAQILALIEGDKQ